VGVSADGHTACRPYMACPTPAFVPRSPPALCGVCCPAPHLHPGPPRCSRWCPHTGQPLGWETRRPVPLPPLLLSPGLPTSPLGPALPTRGAETWWGTWLRHRPGAALQEHPDMLLLRWTLPGLQRTTVSIFWCTMTQRVATCMQRAKPAGLALPGWQPSAARVCAAAAHPRRRTPRRVGSPCLHQPLLHNALSCQSECDTGLVAPSTQRLKVQVKAQRAIGSDSGHGSRHKCSKQPW
jgi:hypothetical protein